MTATGVRGGGRAMAQAGPVRGGVSRRRVLALAPGLAALFASRAWAQRPAAATPGRIGWVSYIGRPDVGLDRLRVGLVELGHAEGKTFVVSPRFANGDFTKIPALVDELLAERLDVLASRGPTVGYLKGAAAKRAGGVRLQRRSGGGRVRGQPGQPGRNMTGITFMALELSAKRVEVLKELVPQATRMALLSNPEHAGELAEYRVTEEAARRVGATITRHLARSAGGADPRAGRDPGQSAGRHARVPGLAHASRAGRRSRTSRPARGSRPCSAGTSSPTWAGSQATEPGCSRASRAWPRSWTRSSREPMRAGCRSSRSAGSR